MPCGVFLSGLTGPVLKALLASLRERPTVERVGRVLAASGLVVFVGIAAVALALRPPAAASPDAAATAEPRVTADPAATAPVDLETARGRLPRDERVDHHVIVVRGLRLPIDGVALPTGPLLLPNSPREYRA